MCGSSLWAPRSPLAQHAMICQREAATARAVIFDVQVTCYSTAKGKAQKEYCIQSTTNQKPHKSGPGVRVPARHAMHATQRSSCCSTRATLHPRHATRSPLRSTCDAQRMHRRGAACDVRRTTALTRRPADQTASERGVCRGHLRQWRGAAAACHVAQRLRKCVSLRFRKRWSHQCRERASHRRGERLPRPRVALRDLE
jgi:hypothetical protein